jgi:serralysin
VRGAGGNDIIHGERGDDSLFGDAGADTLDGGWGKDVLRGGIENDALKGGLNDDYLDGCAGVDTLTGDAGSDRFAFASDAAFNRTNLGLGVNVNNSFDIITDFDRDNIDPFGNTDKILLDTTVFTALSGPLVDGVTFTSVNNLSTAASESAKIIYTKAEGFLVYNPNGSEAGFATNTDKDAFSAAGGGVFAKLSNTPNTLMAADFTVQDVAFIA